MKDCVRAGAPEQVVAVWTVFRLCRFPRRNHNQRGRKSPVARGIEAALAYRLPTFGIRDDGATCATSGARIPGRAVEQTRGILIA